MKTIYVLLIALASFGATHAQSISQYVIGNAGTSLSGTANTINFTMGESVIGLISNGESLGQGFWLGAIEEIVLSNDSFMESTHATVYPNPASNYLSIAFADILGEDFLLQLIDVTGKTVWKGAIANNQATETISLESFATGIYFLKVTRNQHQNSKTFKIIKH